MSTRHTLLLLRIMIHLRKFFLTGLFVITPLAVTLWVIYFLVENIGRPASRLFFNWVPITRDWEILFQFLGVLVVLATITLLGFISKLLLGRLVISLTEQIVHRLPFINTIYATVKQIINTFAEQERAVFQQVVLIQYPKEGTYVIGFLTGDSKGEVQHRTDSDLVNVFVPTTPNPTSGFLLLVPRDEVIFLDMPITDGMKVVISGGAVVPPYQPLATDAGCSANDPAHERPRNVD